MMDNLSILQVVGTNPDAFIAYSGEMMLIQKQEGQNWRVSFALPMDSDSHPFNSYHGKATGKPGTRFMAILVEIDDDEQPVNQEHRRAAKANSMGNAMGKSLVRESGILRNDIYFTRFLWWKLNHMGDQGRLDLENDLPHGLVAEIEETGGKSLADKKKALRFANHVVHYLTGVISCREYAYNKKAADRFNQLRMEFQSWVNKRQQNESSN